MLALPFRSCLLAVGVQLVLCGNVIPAAEPATEEKGFISLFDGKTLQGWEGKEGVFRAKDGAIVAGSLEQKIPRNEFLCTTRDYGDFELRLQARLRGPGANAGVQFRSERIPGHHEVIGYQCDMGVMADRPIWGSLYDESRRRKFLTHGDAAKLAKVLRDDWNDLVIRCQGPHIQIWVNGFQTVDYTEPDEQIPQTGKLALQIHGGEPAEAAYRHIRLRPLPAETK